WLITSHDHGRRVTRQFLQEGFALLRTSVQPQCVQATYIKKTSSQAGVSQQATQTLTEIQSVDESAEIGGKQSNSNGSCQGFGCLPLAGARRAKEVQEQY